MLTAACSKIDVDVNELVIGVEGIGGNFTPLYAENEADINIMSQLYQPIQRRASDNSLINYAGGISYEYVGETQVKYTVSIRDDLVFSDGTKVTIDDVIFFYHLIADASYDGVYSDWYLNDIVGVKEYYFDDANYYASVKGIESVISSSYTASTINFTEYVDYLVNTELEGTFGGSLDSTSPYGKSWRDHLVALGFAEAITDLGDSPSAESVLKLVASAEAEHNPFSYKPEIWYREQLYAEYLKENYEDGIKVEKISGIKKIDDYSCSILFNSRNINAVSAVNAYIISADFYNVEYIKGSADKVKSLSASAPSSGAYCISEHKDGTVTLDANPYSSTKPDFNKIIFKDYAGAKKTAAQAFLDAEVDVATATARADIISSVNTETSKYFISHEDSYLSLFADSKKLNPQVRKAVMGLCDVSQYLSEKIGSYYSLPYMPLSVRFPEYPDTVTEPVYSRETYTAFKISGGEPIPALKIYYYGTENDFDYSIVKAFADILAAESIKYEIILTDAAGLDSAIAKGDADLWFERVYDGATVDKFDYFNSLGLRNRTSLSLPTVDALTERIRQSTGFEDRTTALKDLLALVMSEAVEYPVCQLQKLTLYNTEKISAETFDEFNFDGYNYALCELKSV